MIKYLHYFLFASAADTALIENNLRFIPVFNVMSIILVAMVRLIANI